MQAERGVAAVVEEGVLTRGPESRGSSRLRASVPTCIIVRLSRHGDSESANQPWHVRAGRPTRSAGWTAGGAAGWLPQSGQVNVQSNNYWSGTEYAPNTNNAWNFNFNNGNQNANNKNNNYAWAVRPGG